MGASWRVFCSIIFAWQQEGVQRASLGTFWTPDVLERDPLRLKWPQTSIAPKKLSGRGLIAAHDAITR
jgi:hypothetical protein